MQVEAYLQHDNRAILPLGSTEQHSHLRLTVDCILPERVAVEAAEPLGVPVFPVVAYGVTPYFREYPGTISRASRRTSTSCAISSTAWRTAGFADPHRQRPRRERAAAVRAGMGSRSCALPRGLPQLVERTAYVGHCAAHRPGRVSRLVDGELPVDPPARGEHAGHAATDGGSREGPRARPGRARQYLGDGNYGGLYQRPDEDMLAVWQVAVEETRALFTGGWGD